MSGSRPKAYGGKMKILALDLGTKTGWAYSEGGSGVWDLAPRRHESQGMRGIKFRQSLMEFTQWYTDGTYGIMDLLVYEEIARHLGTHAAHVYGGLVLVLQMFCEDHEINYQGTPVGTIKKFATGKGNASKEMMIKAANDMLIANLPNAHMDVRRITDDNEADAICLLKCAQEQHTGKSID